MMLAASSNTSRRHVGGGAHNRRSSAALRIKAEFLSRIKDHSTVLAHEMDEVHGSFRSRKRRSSTSTASPNSGLTEERLCRHEPAAGHQRRRLCCASLSGYEYRHRRISGRSPSPLGPEQHRAGLSRGGHAPGGS